MLSLRTACVAMCLVCFQTVGASGQATKAGSDIEWYAATGQLEESGRSLNPGPGIRDEALTPATQILSRQGKGPNPEPGQIEHGVREGRSDRRQGPLPDP